MLQYRHPSTPNNITNSQTCHSHTYHVVTHPTSITFPFLVPNAWVWSELYLGCQLGNPSAKQASCEFHSFQYSHSASGLVRPQATGIPNAQALAARLLTSSTPAIGFCLVAGHQIQKSRDFFVLHPKNAALPGLPHPHIIGKLD